jgi:Tfp pilus assembly protein PilF
MMKRPMSILIPSLIFLIAVGCASTRTEDRIKQATAHYQLGLSYLNDNNIQPAYVEFQKALEFNPNDKEALNALGLINLLKFEDYPKAIDYFTRAVKIDGNYSDAVNNLGVAYEKSGKFREAVDAYQRALSSPVYRNAEKAFNNLGRAYYRMKKYAEAVDAYKESLRRFSDFHPPYYGLALCYNAVGRYDSAATSLKRAIELDPDFKGDREKFVTEMKSKKLLAKGGDEQDIEDLLEILKY